MKKVGNHTSISRILFFCLALSLTFSVSYAQQAAPAAAPEAATATAAAAPAAGAGDPVKGKSCLMQIVLLVTNLMLNLQALL